jgi:C4-dicarboxylate-specific signal transduction histidine kinase
MINIDFINNGGIIDPQIIGDIFNPYFSTKEEKNGVGLSLYIAKMIIEFHMKGKLKVMNGDNDEVRFTISLPQGQEES